MDFSKLLMKYYLDKQWSCAISSFVGDLELEYKVDIISDVIDKAIELDLDVENLTEMRGLMCQMDSTNFGPPTDDEPFRYEFAAPLGT